MPPTADTRYVVQFHERDLGALLDMLRYDRPVVEAWSHPDAGRYTVTLSGTYPTVERWWSFSLYPRDPRTSDKLAAR